MPRKKAKPEKIHQEDFDFNELKKAFEETDKFMNLTIEEIQELKNHIEFSFMDWQKDFINACLKERRILLAKSRQIGGTHTVTFVCFLMICLSKMKGDFFYQSKKESTAKDFLRSIRMWMELSNITAQSNVVSLDGITALEIKFENGCRLVILSSNPSSVISITPLAIFLDEFAINKNCKELYGLVLPSVEWKGKLIILSTVRDKANYFSVMIDEIENKGNPKGWTFLKVTLFDAIAQGLVKRMNFTKILMGRAQDVETDEAFLQRKKDESPSVSEFEREYGVVPSDKIDAGSPFKDVIVNPVKRSRSQCDKIFNKAKAKPRYYMGYDVGRAENGDQSSLDVSADCDGILVPRIAEAFRGMKFDDQQKMLEEKIRHYRPVKVCIDASSLGWHMAENLHTLFPDVVIEVKFSGAAKITLLVAGLIKAMTDQICLVLDEQEFKDSLSSIRETKNDKDEVSYWLYRVRAKDQTHGDMAVARFLCVEAWNLGKSSPIGATTEELNNMIDEIIGESDLINSYLDNSV